MKQQIQETKPGYYFTNPIYTPGYHFPQFNEAIKHFGSAFLGSVMDGQTAWDVYLNGQLIIKGLDYEA